MTYASCGSVTASTLGLPDSCAIPAQKGTLPKGIFVAKVQISAKTKQHLVHDVEQINFLALLRPANTGLAEGKKIPEIMVLGLKLAPEVEQIPLDMVELITMQRKSGILFVAVRETEQDGATVEEASLAVRRPWTPRAGHAPVHETYTTRWEPADEVFVELEGQTTDEAWDSLCSQVALGTTGFADVDSRIAKDKQIRSLKRTIGKLTNDHQRARTPEQRNEIYAKLHHAKKELEELQAE